jgi:hypothetical protein
MRRLRWLACASWEERFLVVRALFVVCSIRLGLWLLPIGTVRRFVLRTGKTRSVCPSIPRLVWAVRAVSRIVPLATCLTQALTLQWLLSRYGHPSRIHLGARRNSTGRFEAHAWVECEGRVVIGGAEAPNYVSLANWEGTA